LNEVFTLVGGTLEQQSANSYELIWNTGQQLHVTNTVSYLAATISLPNSDAGKVQALLGNDAGTPGADLMLPVAAGHLRPTLRPVRRRACGGHR
jgi:hypothetical protein